MPPLLGTTGAASAKGFGFTATVSLGGGGYAAFVAYNTRSGTQTVGNVFATSTGVTFASTVFNNGCVDTNANYGTFSTSFVQGFNKYGYASSGYSLDFQAMAYSATTDRLYVGVSNNKYEVYSYGPMTGTPAQTSSYQRALSTGSYQLTLPVDMDVDASGNIYYSGLAYATVCCSSYYVPFLAKGTTTSLTWARYGTYNPSVNIFTYNVVVASSGNIYQLGNYSPGYTLLQKFNSTGTRQFIYTYDSTRNEVPGYAGLTVDSSENVYAACGSSSPFTLALMKFNSSGVMQFRIEITGSNVMPLITGLIYGSDGYLYLFARMQTTSTLKYQMALFKFNTSGTLQYQRVFTSTSGSSFGITTTFYAKKCVSLSSDGFLYLGAMFNWNGNNIKSATFFKYGASGATTGSYTLGAQNITIAAGAYTVTTGSTSASTTVSNTVQNATLGTVDTVTPNYGNTGYTATTVAI